MQKTNRSVNWGLYGTAFVISAVIFGVGFWLGVQIEKGVAAEVSNQIGKVRQNIGSLETLFLLEDSSMFCGSMTFEMDKFDSETFDLGARIGFMEEHKGIDPSLKSEYMSLELRDYLLVQKINKKCGGNVTTILYFLSSSSCEECRSQGLELTKTRESIAARVYSFDLDINNSFVNAFAASLKVTQYPAIVVNNRVYTGFTPSDSILRAVRGSA